MEKTVQLVLEEVKSEVEDSNSQMPGWTSNVKSMASSFSKDDKVPYSEAKDKGKLFVQETFTASVGTSSVFPKNKNLHKSVTFAANDLS